MDYKIINKYVGQYAVLASSKHVYCGQIAVSEKGGVTLRPGAILPASSLEQIADHELGLLGAIFERFHEKSHSDVVISPGSIHVCQSVPAPSPRELAGIIKNYVPWNTLEQELSPYTRKLSKDDKLLVAQEAYDPQRLLQYPHILVFFNISPAAAFGFLKDKIPCDHGIEFCSRYSEAYARRQDIAEVYIGAVQSGILSYQDGLKELKKLRMCISNGVSTVSTWELNKFQRECSSLSA